MILAMVKASHEEAGLAGRRTRIQVNELQLLGHLHSSLKSPILTGVWTLSRRVSPSTTA